jgi:hypothetical protein
MDYFNNCKKNWDRTYADVERWEKLQEDWCKHIKDTKSSLIHMALVVKKKTPSVGEQQDVLPDVPNVSFFLVMKGMKEMSMSA